eukprot:1747828-Pleurochrysis_carterae.AAC.1
MNTRRCIVELRDLPLPRACFEAFMAPAKDGEVEGLKRDDGTGLFVPTNADKPTASINKYEYTVTRPSLTDRLCQLELSDLRRGPHKSLRSPLIQCGASAVRVLISSMLTCPSRPPAMMRSCSTASRQWGAT